jgi:hypothetical protein
MPKIVFRPSCPIPNAATICCPSNQHEPCWYVRKKNAPWFGKAGENSTIWACPSPKFIMGGSGAGRLRLSVCLFRTGIWLTAWMGLERGSARPKPHGQTGFLGSLPQFCSLDHVQRRQGELACRRYITQGVQHPISPFRRLLPFGLYEFFDVPPERRSHRRRPCEFFIQVIPAF